MPRCDGTGPIGHAPGRGRGMGAVGRWAREKGFGVGPGGYCICQYCGYMEQHQIGRPCFMRKCPKCGEIMTRELVPAGGRDER